MKTITYNPETHVLVPREPSEEMCDAATADSCWEDMNPPPSVAYRLMLAAAPQPEPLGEPFSTILRENLDSLYEDDGKPPKPVDVGSVAEHELQDTRCECCGYMTYHREHMGCIRASAPQPDRVVELEVAMKVALAALKDFDYDKRMEAIARIEGVMK